MAILDSAIDSTNRVITQSVLTGNCKSVTASSQYTWNAITHEANRALTYDDYEGIYAGYKWNSSDPTRVVVAEDTQEFYPDIYFGGLRLGQRVVVYGANTISGQFSQVWSASIDGYNYTFTININLVGIASGSYSPFNSTASTYNTQIIVKRGSTTVATINNPTGGYVSASALGVGNGKEIASAAAGNSSASATFGQSGTYSATSITDYAYFLPYAHTVNGATTKTNGLWSTDGNMTMGSTSYLVTPAIVRTRNNTTAGASKYPIGVELNPESYYYVYMKAPTTTFQHQLSVTTQKYSSTYSFGVQIKWYSGTTTTNLWYNQLGTYMMTLPLSMLEDTFNQYMWQGATQPAYLGIRIQIQTAGSSGNIELYNPSVGWIGSTSQTWSITDTQPTFQWYASMHSSWTDTHTYITLYVNDMY